MKMEDEKMKKIMDITNRKDVEVWSVEVYREEYLTEENEDTWNFWDDTKYITVEKVLYLLENEDEFSLADNLYYWAKIMDINENLLILTIMNIDKILAKNFILSS